ncbi:MAG: preprotein translocase subunit YajC [Dehalococcoidales bacterium]|nr:preprotein translocase subunit YajC [Dehalococcoidales bacterium]
MVKKIIASLLGLTSIISLGMLSSCVPATGESNSSSTIYMILFMVVLFGIFYFLIIRPQGKRQKEHQNLLSNLQVGDRIITIGGIYGRIESIREDSYIIKVESGELLRMTKSAIAGKQPDESK